ncbi:hypothetical protein Ssi02_58090 [Sinosporangium siamense]|uniref:Uncharacterized protein n=1 Tax=Sinosporangium siamense TaxID=1367973 RepID=A0A919RKQ7_9ACTN|nr:hypothetical protein Ssi02_58090 [Sinosporangium siamense]
MTSWCCMLGRSGFVDCAGADETVSGVCAAAGGARSSLIGGESAGVFAVAGWPVEAITMIDICVANSVAMVSRTAPRLQGRIHI